MTRTSRSETEPTVEWSKDDPRFIFVQGAKWWEWASDNATMWPADVRRAEEEAAKRYPPTASLPAERGGLTVEEIEHRMQWVVQCLSYVAPLADDTRAEIDAIRDAALAWVRQDARADEWQPIETAPPYPFVAEKWFQNGPRYLLWDGFATIGSYGYTQKGKGRWQGWRGTINPTYWQPLPAAPVARTADEKGGKT